MIQYSGIYHCKECKIECELIEDFITCPECGKSEPLSNGEMKELRRHQEMSDDEYYGTDSYDSSSMHRF